MMFGATDYTAQISMQIFKTIFPWRIISRFADITRPALSPYLAVPNYFLWGQMKSLLSETRLANNEDLNSEFGRVITSFLSQF